MKENKVEDRKRTAMALHKGGLSQKEAAEKAGIDRTTLWRALKKAKTATEQLDRVRGGKKREALEMLLQRQMELIYDAMQRLPPEELDKQGAAFLKDLARTGTVNMGILLDKIAKIEQETAGGDNRVEVIVKGLPELPETAQRVLRGEPIAPPEAAEQSDQPSE